MTRQIECGTADADAFAQVSRLRAPVRIELDRRDIGANNQDVFGDRRGKQFARRRRGRRDRRFPDLRRPCLLYTSPSPRDS